MIRIVLNKFGDIEVVSIVHFNSIWIRKLANMTSYVPITGDETPLNRIMTSIFQFNIFGNDVRTLDCKIVI